MTSQLLNRPGLPTRSALSWLNHLQDLPDHELARAWRDVLCKERDLPAVEQRRCALERVYAWLAMDEVDPALIAAFEQALETFPCEDAQSILERERDATLHGLSYADYSKLARLLRWLELPPTPASTPGDRLPEGVVPLAAALLSGGVRTG